MKRACAILLLSLGVIIFGIIVFVKPVGQATEWEAIRKAFPSDSVIIEQDHGS